MQGAIQVLGFLSILCTTVSLVVIVGGKPDDVTVLIGRVTLGDLPT